MNINNIIEENIKKYENYLFDEKEYEKVKRKYYFKFFDFPPKLVGLNYQHPIFMFLMENAIKTGKKIDDNDLNEAIEIFNVYDKDKEY